METRLSLFDDVFMEILLGLALALLFGIGFAPRLVGITEESSTMACECQGEESGETGKAVTCECEETPRVSNIPFMTWFTNGHWSVLLLWVFICLFVFKLIHEPSVMRYHAKKDDMRDPGYFGNVLLFIAKLMLLVSLYIFIIIVYVHSKAKVSDPYVAWIFALLLVTCFIIPNVIEYLQLAGKSNPYSSRRRNWLRETVAVWLALDIVNIIVIWLIVAPPPVRWIPAAVAGVLFLISIFYVLLRSSLPNSTWAGRLRDFIGDIRHRGWKVRLTLCVFIVVPVAAEYWIIPKVILPNFGKALNLPGEIAHYGILVVLGVNLVDWLLNWRFFFGKPPS